jgi:hypothetical protein
VTRCRHRPQQAIEVQQDGLHSTQPTPAGSTAKRIIRAVPVSDTSPPALVLHKTSTWHAVYARLIRRLQACLLTQPVGGISTARYATRPWPPSLSTPGTSTGGALQSWTDLLTPTGTVEVSRWPPRSLAAPQALTVWQACRLPASPFGVFAAAVHTPPATCPPVMGRDGVEWTVGRCL